MSRIAIIIIALFLGSGLMLRAQDYSELNLALAKGNYAEVILRGRPLIEQGGATGKLLELVAMAHEGLEQKDRALECYQLALPFSSDSLRIENSIGRCLVGLGRIREAMNTYIRVLAVDSTNSFANIQLAKIYFSQREYAKASSIYGMLAAMDTSNYYFFKQAGECYNQMGLYPFAITMYTEAFRINPRDPALGLSLALCHLRTGHFTPTLAVIDEAQKYDSLNIPLLRYEGLTYMYKNDFERSDSIFYKLVDMGDTTLFTLSRLGFSLMGRNYVFRAIKPLERAYALDSTDYDLLTNLATAASQAVSPEKGFYYYQRLEDALRPKPDKLAAVFSGRGEIYTRQRNYNAAYDWFKKAYATEPGNLIHLANAGRALYYKKDYSKSKKCYQEFVETYDKLERAGHDFSTDPAVFHQNSMVRAYLRELENPKDSPVSNSVKK